MERRRRKGTDWKTKLNACPGLQWNLAVLWVSVHKAHLQQSLERFSFPHLPKLRSRVLQASLRRHLHMPNLSNPAEGREGSGPGVERTGSRGLSDFMEVFWEAVGLLTADSTCLVRVEGFNICHESQGILLALCAHAGSCFFDSRLSHPWSSPALRSTTLLFNSGACCSPHLMHTPSFEPRLYAASNKPL